ncbi:uncharacterized protein N7511_001058 [Penicillium nucicola]|uniref:uncharacterized protein n=1 Tax=Penicillium nucicola TaxID=1850975 RepID=UPI002544D586|nr:uncharacterized protein N7511_001058 [Penicillium nucicola]KAJ5776047.1 hypothetical protein N7511_001058 [Penicillium nucicola]
MRTLQILLAALAALAHASPVQNADTTPTFNTSMNGTRTSIPLPLPLRLSQITTMNDLVHTSTIPFGISITHCTVPGTIALTFDDGPFIYTPQMLDTLSIHGARCTFFLNGQNKGSIYAFPDLVQRIFAEGHQIGSHTWNHLPLDTLPYPDIIRQMTALEEAFQHILGFIPTYMRAPYLYTNPVVLQAMTDLGYHVVGASIDTKDYENDDPGTSWRSFERFKVELDAGGNVVLAHDSHENTVTVLVDNLLGEIERRGLSPVTIGECLGDPAELWYRWGGR